MQTIYLDISNKGVIPTIHAKQGDVGRKFLVVLTDSGIPYAPPAGSIFSAWYEGDSGEGNYTDIGEKSAFSANGNKVTVEMIAQMLSNDGDGVLSLVLNDPNGNQISTWNIPYVCEFVPGIDSEAAENYYTAFSNAVQNLPYPDASLSVAGKAADAAATGAALNGKAPNGYGLGGGQYTTDFNTCLANGWYWGNSGTKNPPSGFTTNCSCFAIARTESQIYQYFQYPSNGCVLQRYTTNGGATWIEEWVNPPMQLSVEYRTTERWNGKAVYTKLVNFGALPNTKMRAITVNNTVATQVVGFSGIFVDTENPGVSGDLTGMTDVIGHYTICDPNSIQIGIETDRDSTKYNAFIVLKYTKD